jgi:hypothetical protein
MLRGPFELAASRNQRQRKVISLPRGPNKQSASLFPLLCELRDLAAKIRWEQQTGAARFRGDGPLAALFERIREPVPSPCVCRLMQQLRSDLTVMAQPGYWLALVLLLFPYGVAVFFLLRICHCW